MAAIQNWGLGDVIVGWQADSHSSFLMLEIWLLLRLTFIPRPPGPREQCASLAELAVLIICSQPNPVTQSSHLPSFPSKEAKNCLSFLTG